MTGDQLYSLKAERIFSRMNAARHARLLGVNSYVPYQSHEYRCHVHPEAGLVSINCAGRLGTEYEHRLMVLCCICLGYLGSACTCRTRVAPVEDSHVLDSPA